jgi:hypothetical protein
VVWHLRRTHPGVPVEDERSVVFRVVKNLLESGLVVAGWPTPDSCGFIPWSLTTNETLARIEAEWDALGRDPTIGGIVWFTTSEAGDRLFADD